MAIHRALRHEIANPAARLGVLDREAQVLRSELLVQEGKVKAAQTLSVQFQRDYPNDAHVSHVRALLREAEK